MDSFQSSNYLKENCIKIVHEKQMIHVIQMMTGLTGLSTSIGLCDAYCFLVLLYGSEVMMLNNSQKVSLDSTVKRLNINFSIQKMHMSLSNFNIICLVYQLPMPSV